LSRLIGKSFERSLVAEASEPGPIVVVDDGGDEGIALIAYVLLKILHQTQRITAPLKRVAALAQNYLFNPGGISPLIRPPDKTRKPEPLPQLAFNFPGQ